MPSSLFSYCHDTGGSGKKQLRLRQRGRERFSETESWSAAAVVLSGKAAQNCIEGGVGYKSIPLALYHEADKTVDHQVKAALDFGESVRAHLRIAVQREEEMRQGILNVRRERALQKIREHEQRASGKSEKIISKSQDQNGHESGRLCDGKCETDQGWGFAHAGRSRRKRAKRSKSPGNPRPDLDWPSALNSQLVLVVFCKWH